MRRPWFVRGALIVGVSALILAAACSRDPNVRKQKYFDSGQRYLAKGKYPEAAIQFENAIQVDGKFAAAHYQLAQTYLRLQDVQHAYLETARTLDLRPDNYKAHADMANMLALDYSSTSNPSALTAAQEHLDVLLQKRPNDPDTHLAFANLLNAQKKYSQGMAEVQKAIALAPNRGDSYLELARFETKVDQFDAAEANYKKAIDLQTTAMNGRMALAAFYQLRGRYQEAEQEVESVISSDPKDLNARASLAKLYIAQGKKTDAEAFLNQVKRDFPNDSKGYRMLGDYFLAEGESDRAVAEYASLHNQHPKDVVVSKNYIQLLLLKNRVDEAEKLNERLLGTKGANADTLTFRGEIQLRQGKIDEAFQTLQAVVANNPGLAVAHYQLGIALNQRGEMGQAASEWQQALRIQPTMTDAYRALAGVSLRQGDMQGLEQYAGELIRLEPAAIEGYAFRAQSFLARKQFARAEADARKAIEVAPQSFVGYLEMGILNFVEQKLPAAENWYEQALAHDPNSIDSLQGLVNVYLRQKQPDRAIARVNAEIARSANNSALYDLLGSLELGRRNLPAAEIALEKAAELNKNNVDAIVKLGQVQTARGNLDQALASWSEGARENPKAAAFYIVSGAVYEQKHDLEKARASYEKAHQLKPDDPAIANDLAYLMLETNGNLDLALALAQAARRAMPGSPDVADTMGSVFYRKGLYGAAISLFEEALKLGAKNRQAENPTFHYHLAQAYEKAEKPALAREHFERALKIDPNYSAAAEIRKQLAQLKG